MNSKTNDWGPAFPGIRIKQIGDPAYTAPTQIYFTGMTLRDYFAAKAMQGLIENIESLDRYFNENSITTREEMTSSVSEIAYDYANAMLAAKKE